MQNHVFVEPPHCRSWWLTSAHPKVLMLDRCWRTRPGQSPARPRQPLVTSAEFLGHWGRGGPACRPESLSDLAMGPMWDRMGPQGNLVHVADSQSIKTSVIVMAADSQTFVNGKIFPPSGVRKS
jgi:hypothetical protein